MENYEVLYDVNNQLLKPGDYVSIKTYPRGTDRGWLVISKTWTVRDATPALSMISEDGVRYCCLGAVKKLKVQKEMPTEILEHK